MSGAATTEMDGQNKINWLNGRAKKFGVVEKICPRRHVRQNDWETKWNEEYLTPSDTLEYDYISDYECIFYHPIDKRLQEIYQRHWNKLQAAKKRGTSVKVSKLAHFTDPEAAELIVEKSGFRGGLKKINEDDEHNNVEANLSWWSPIFSEKVKNNVRKHLEEVITPFTDENNDDLNALKKKFATSDAFQPNPVRYGGVYFKYGMNKLCQHYRQLIDGEPQYKILGTFGYKQEVMHAVLVCSEADGAGRFKDYPKVLKPEEDSNNEAVITRDNDNNWYWRPQATGGGEILRLQAHSQNYPRFRRWEHVAFAFHIPDDEIMVCDSPADHRKSIE